LLGDRLVLVSRSVLLLGGGAMLLLGRMLPASGLLGHGTRLRSGIGLARSGRCGALRLFTHAQHLPDPDNREAQVFGPGPH
jgi:hypothetical protein